MFRLLLMLMLVLCPSTLGDEDENSLLRIINGFSCDIQEAPYQVSLRNIHLEYRRLGSGHFCGGTILSHRVVITAAHCLWDHRPRDTVVVAGCTLLNTKSPTMKRLRISYWTTHNNDQFGKNDIALIFTSSDIVRVHGAIAYLSLNTNELSAGTLCLVSGWGRSNHYVPMSTNDLRAQWVAITDEKVCLSIYNGLHGVICAGDWTTTGPSKGDSGGPLRCNDKLSGVVSVGLFSGGPTAYTSIRYFEKWIQDEIASYSGVWPLRPFDIQSQFLLAIGHYMLTR